MKLNLNDSKPPSGLDFTSVFQSPSQPPKTYSLQEVGKMTQGLIDAFTNESVVGYERNKAVLDLHKQLQGAQGADRLRLSIELKNAKALEYVERNDFMSMVHDFQGIAGAAAAFASPEIAQQIQVISTHFVNVGVQVAGLAGYGPLAADGAVTPIGFGTAILTAIGHISSVFGKKSGITIERATYEAIGVLSKQIDQLREEMHRRFDDIQFQLFMVSSDIMIQFGLLHKKIDQIDTQLAQIHAAIGSNYKQLQYTLGSISQSVSDLGRQVLDQETRRATKSLTDIIDPILYNINNGYMTDAEFSKLSGQLLAAIHSSVHQKEVAGNLTNLSDSEVAKWQPTRDSVQWANYQINSVRAYADTAMRRPVGKEVGNPLLLAYTTLALLLINRRRYSTSPDPLALHVSITEMDAIKKVVSEIDEANKALAPLQDPVLYLTLFSYIKASAQAFGNAYEDEIKAFQTEKAGELDLDTAKARTKKHELDIKQFKSQKIEPNWKGGEARYEWFRAEHKVSDGSFSNTCVPSLNQGMGECTAGKSMSELKAYVTRMENEFKASTNEYADLGANIAYPAEDYPGKLLPIPPSLVEKIVNTLPKNIQHAVELNQLQLRFQYVIKNEATEVKVKKDNLSSSGWFRSLREPSKPKFHLQLWIENRLCYSVSFPYSMPIHTPGESEWLYWVGGTRPMGGVKCVGFGSGSHRNCSWTQQIYMPIIEHHAGYIKTFDPNSTKSAASQIDIEVIAKIANQRITQQYDILRTEFNTFIRPKVETDYKSELGKRITAFEANIKRLKALLALAFPEIHSHNHVLYRAMYESDVPLSRESFLSYLENNPSLLGNEVFVPLEKFITKLEEQVIKAVNSLKLTAANPLLALASTELQDWIKEFGPTAVESNKIAPCPVGKEPHDALRQQMQRNSQLEVVLMGLARTVNGLSPELAQSILEETRRNIGDIVSANPHVLGDETTPPDSVARLLVVSSPLFTSPGPQPALPPPAPKGPNNP